MYASAEPPTAVFVSYSADEHLAEKAFAVSRDLKKCAESGNRDIRLFFVESTSEAESLASKSSGRALVLDAERSGHWILTEFGNAQAIAEIQNADQAPDSKLSELSRSGCQHVLSSDEIAHFWLVLTCTRGDCEEFREGKVTVDGYEEARAVNSYPWESYWPLEKSDKGFTVRIRYASGQKMTTTVYQTKGGRCSYALPDDYKRSHKRGGWARLRDCP